MAAQQSNIKPADGNWLNYGLIFFVFLLIAPYFGALFVVYFLTVAGSGTPWHDIFILPLLALQFWPLAMFWGGVQALLVGVVALLTYYFGGQVRLLPVVAAATLCGWIACYFFIAPGNRVMSDVISSPYFYSHPFSALMAWLLVARFRNTRLRDGGAS